MIKGIALGSYFAPRHAGAQSSANVSAMRGLVYALKDNSDPPNAKQPIGHPLHPSQRAVMVNRDNAVEYVADMAGRYKREIRASLGIAGDVVIVPVPSSGVTRSNVGTVRWPALRLARAQSISWSKTRMRSGLYPRGAMSSSSTTSSTMDGELQLP
jgi:hypothetical protein